MFLASADWMPRNFFRRVEIAFPIEDPALRDEIINEVLPRFSERPRQGARIAVGRHLRPPQTGRRRSRVRRHNYIFGNALADRPANSPNPSGADDQTLRPSPLRSLHGEITDHEEGPGHRYRRHAREADDLPQRKAEIRVWTEIVTGSNRAGTSERSAPIGDTTLFPLDSPPRSVTEKS